MSGVASFLGFGSKKPDQKGVQVQQKKIQQLSPSQRPVQQFAQAKVQQQQLPKGQQQVPKAPQQQQIPKRQQLPKVPQQKFQLQVQQQLAPRQQQTIKTTTSQAPPVLLKQQQRRLQRPVFPALQDIPLPTQQQQKPKTARKKKAVSTTKRSLKKIQNLLKDTYKEVENRLKGIQLAMRESCPAGKPYSPSAPPNVQQQLMKPVHESVTNQIAQLRKQIQYLKSLNAAPVVVTPPKAVPAPPAYPSRPPVKPVVKAVKSKTSTSSILAAKQLKRSVTRLDRVLGEIRGLLASNK